MTPSNLRKSLLCLSLAIALSQPAQAQMTETFVASDIRVDGLQRISAGTVFTYLPIEKGDMVNSSKTTEAIRALYKTGFFSDVRFERQGNILVVNVTERPSINTLTLKGNKEIKTEDLLKGLKGIGLSEGEIYNPLNLDRVTQELLRQYNNKGKYNVVIVPTVKEIDRNRVDVSLDITEGKSARLRDINIVGNTIYADDVIREGWESNTSNWLSWYKRDDQYSREKLSGDLEKLTDYYLDRGYVDFNVESTQVTISPDKKDMFLTANVVEGRIYKVTGVSVSGETIVPKQDVEKLLLIKTGNTFSRQLLTATTDRITAMLGNIGYAFAEVDPVPTISRDDQEISIDFVVKPGPRVQIRRLEIKGNVRTADEVVRRELRQFENTWYSQAALDRSKIRLQRLGFFETVEIEQEPVAGRPDQVDVFINVKERNSGSFVFGLGYQQLYGLTASVQLSENNFLGTGNRMSVVVQNNSYSKRTSFSYTNPYFTEDGLSLGYNVSYSDYNQGDFNTARYTSTNFNAEAVMGIPLSETDSVQLALGYDKIDLTTTVGSTPLPLIEYLDDVLGAQPYFPCFDVDDDNNPDTPATDDDGSIGPDQQTCGFNQTWPVKQIRAQAGWGRDSRNDYLLPTLGTYHRVGAEFSFPGSDIAYYKLSYQFEHYRPLNSWLVLKIGTDLGYGDSYGNTGDAGMPFFKNFYVGGPQSVRGYEANTLGPSYGSCIPVAPSTTCVPSYLQPLGGSLKVAGTFELLFPKLFNARGTRLSAFLDYGNAFAGSFDYSGYTDTTIGAVFGADKINFSALRASVGVALQWQAPVGPISISYAMPLNDGEFDRIERLQFTFGQQF
ncbi:outer membrane protein assembly factor BamA [Arenimonas sp.]|jgi:outer membrane protein insertion porin family|uniref:outer membrane protein assembly factor BamA n=1 Tax=Arenimonas sp. TaxID=1872635 RepID=UPI0037BFA750